MKKDLIVVCGPTASGKTALSIKLAKALNGEIISADSMQIYRGLDVGTAKVTESEADGVPHHMIDVVDPNQSFSVAEYVKMTRAVIEDVVSRGKTPIIAGGTGLYVNSLIFGYKFSNTDIDENLRQELQDFCDSHGKEALHELLRELNPERAEALHVNDVKRVIRAIEVCKQGECCESNVDESKQYEYKAIMLEPDRSVLYERINNRVDLMIKNGLIDEARTAIERYNLNLEHQSMQAIGYKELYNYLNGKESLEDAVDTIKRVTRNYAKRQLTWFKKFPNVKIFKAPDLDEILKYLYNS